MAKSFILSPLCLALLTGFYSTQLVAEEHELCDHLGCQDLNRWFAEQSTSGELKDLPFDLTIKGFHVSTFHEVIAEYTPREKVLDREQDFSEVLSAVPDEDSKKRVIKALLEKEAKLIQEQLRKTKLIDWGEKVVLDVDEKEWLEDGTGTIAVYKSPHNAIKENLRFPLRTKHESMKNFAADNGSGVKFTDVGIDRWVREEERRPDMTPIDFSQNASKDCLLEQLKEIKRITDDPVLRGFVEEATRFSREKAFEDIDWSELRHTDLREGRARPLLDGLRGSKSQILVRMYQYHDEDELPPKGVPRTNIEEPVPILSLKVYQSAEPLSFTARFNEEGECDVVSKEYFEEFYAERDTFGITLNDYRKVFGKKAQMIDEGIGVGIIEQLKGH